MYLLLCWNEESILWHFLLLISKSLYVRNDLRSNDVANVMFLLFYLCYAKNVAHVVNLGRFLYFQTSSGNHKNDLRY